ncbi:MAG: PEGA domain-containing protein [Agathobacter sp.]|nr:PEGA domain-containing protein [Agathobacter sp.]
MKLLSKIQFYICLGLLFLLAGCARTTDSAITEGTEKSQEAGSETESLLETEAGSETELLSQSKKDQEVVADLNLYAVVQWNTEEHKVRLYRYATDMEYEYRYADSTLFRDKYGDYAKESVFVPGSIVHIGGMDADGNLIRMQMADEVWVYENVSKYSIQEDRGIFQIADTRYRWEDDLYVFSQDDRIRVSDISSEDVISVTGYGKTILSVVITRGQGTLELSNTELFEGGLLQLGTKIYKEITENMTLEVPEGTYVLSVANKGWGDSTEITINRGEATVVDLDTLKGAGPSYGAVYFKVDITNAKLYVDGEEKDHTMLQRLVYGKHKITVEADGYDTWSKYLYVNSEQATIEITLDEETVEEITTSEAEDDDDDDDEDSQSESEKREEEKEEALEEYYTTLTDMIASMT